MPCSLPTNFLPTHALITVSMNLDTQYFFLAFLGTTSAWTSVHQDRDLYLHALSVLSPPSYSPQWCGQRESSGSGVGGAHKCPLASQRRFIIGAAKVKKPRAATNPRFRFSFLKKSQFIVLLGMFQFAVLTQVCEKNRRGGILRSSFCAMFSSCP